MATLAPRRRWRLVTSIVYIRIHAYKVYRDIDFTWANLLKYGKVRVYYSTRNMAVVIRCIRKYRD